MLLAENGVAGVEVFKQQFDQITLVVLDMTMPVMSGAETFDRLKAIRSDVPIILSSGFSEVDAVQRFKRLGLAGFIQKPYTGAALAGKAKEFAASRV